jgi:putative phosphoesterase
MKIGIISDTHNFLDPRVPEIFAGVEHILHAGDVGDPMLIAELEAIAPLTAVTGNTDSGLPLRDTELVTLGGKKFLIHHIVTPGLGSPSIDRRLRVDAPDVCVFGHTHKPYAKQVENIFFFNPGYAGRQRFELPRSVAIFELHDGTLSHRFISL